MPERDDRPFYALAIVAGLVAVALLVPASRAWLALHVAEPLRAQADPQPGLQTGYTLQSLAFWAAIGAAFAWALYELAFVRAGLRADRTFFLALAPFLVVGPLFHALLASGAIPTGTPFAYLAAEPLIYLSTAALAAVGLALGHLLRRPLAAPLLVGGAAIAALAIVAAPRVSPAGLGRAALLLVMGIVPGIALGYGYHKARPAIGAGAAAAVVAAHGLDGATTWMVLRDPFGLGFTQFAERNPVSQFLVDLSDGWPYYAVKLALPIVLLSLVKVEEGEERLLAFLLFAVFILGFGPGMANLLQVMLK